MCAFPPPVSCVILCVKSGCLVYSSNRCELFPKFYQLMSFEATTTECSPFSMWFHAEASSFTKLLNATRTLASSSSSLLSSVPTNQESSILLTTRLVLSFTGCSPFYSAISWNDIFTSYPATLKTFLECLYIDAPLKVYLFLHSSLMCLLTITYFFLFVWCRR